MALPAGTRLGRYEVCSLLGKGGMGEVYLAEDTKLDRKVAIKFLNQEFSRDADKLRRFIQEAKAASALNHPNILTVYEVGEADGINYIAAEFIEGMTLRERLSPKEPLPLNQILKIGIQVSEALSAAHQAGIIHRDIKPENIMIRRDGYAKVLDFGLAKLTEKRPADEVSLEGATKAFVQTNPGMVMGTVSYMSPEQARGKETDARTDIWSLGVVLYEMLAGRVPFTGETINHTIVSILEKEPLLLENVPDELQRIARKALTKDKEMRYQTARDLLIDLKNLHRTLDIQGELERSVIPNKADATDAGRENATQAYPTGAGAATRGEGEAAKTQAAASVSSLEYAVTQAKSHKLAAIAGIVLLGIISAVTYFGFFAKSKGGQINSIAVLPFENKGGNPDSEYLSDGLAESLIYRLSQLPNLKVSPTSSAFRYKGKETDPIKIGNELGVRAVMSGRIVQRGENLTVSVELVDVRNNKLIWGEQYERKMSELLATQREIAAEITNKLRLKLSGEGEQKLAKKYTDNNEAYQLYLKGRFYWNKRDEENFRKAIDQFKAAAEKDPKFALAFVGLADCYALLPEYASTPTSEALPQAKAYVERALEIDDSLGEAHVSLANVNTLLWNWDEANKGYKHGIELNPNYATGYKWYGIQLDTLGRLDEALAEYKRAQELEPLSLSINLNIADNYLARGDLDAAVEQCRRILDLDPNWYYVRRQLGLAYLKQGRTAEALAEAEKSVELSKRHSVPLGMLGYIDAQTGKRGEAAAVIEELMEKFAERQANGYDLANVYVGLGEKDQAFAWLEKDFQSRSSVLPYWLNLPPLNSLRDDPRFKDLARRMGLPELK
ncbi:MAG: protein kinase [Acidobacteriota bacterium]|nr:protein kinase [Acidobacteriota bacterium]